MYKHFCDVCEYGTNKQNLYKKHLVTQKHIRNSRESSVTIDIVKYKKPKTYEKINIEIYPENDEEPNKTIDIFTKLTDELTELRQENMALKMNMEFKYSNEHTGDFISVFDDDFTNLFLR